ncbi:MAG TPA: hypothetical protein DCX95_07805 [Elusimicrobia bacterium]|nr:hypothetical protein [Elusimicrobiota bacterium]
MNLIKQLEEYRLKNGISQQKLAKILGVGYVTVNRWFMERGMPNKIKTYRIKKFLEKTSKKF